jgi:dihydrofolate reductase
MAHGLRGADASWEMIASRAKGLLASGYSAFAQARENQAHDKPALKGILGWLRQTFSMHTRRLAVPKLIYSTVASLDGYIADENGNFDWAAPDEEVHAFVNDLERPIGTYLYGRRMYEVMVAWETMDTSAEQPPTIQDYTQIWRGADKIVYSRTLKSVSSARTRIERDFDPEAIRQMKAATGRDITMGGPELAAQAIKAGLVDEYHLFLAPILVGSGKQSLPNHVRVKLELLDERRFGSGVVHLHYRARM